MLVILPALILFIVFIIIKLLIPDYLTEFKDLQSDHGVIQDVYANQYIKRRVYYDCVDIILKDKPYFIRLSDNVIERFKTITTNKNNIGKTIQLNYQQRLLHGNILHNPNQIEIDNKIIIPFDSKHTLIGWIVIICAVFIFVFFYLIYVALKTYRNDFYISDKEAAQLSKWKLLFIWLTE